MSNRDDENNKQTDGQQGWSDNENLFGDFNDEDAFEDSDRDSDFAAIYTEAEEEDPEPTEGDDLSWELEEEFSDDEFSEEENWPTPTDSAPTEPDLWDTDPNPPGSFDDEPPADEDSLPQQAASVAAVTDPDESWDHPDEDGSDPNESWEEPDEDWDDAESEEYDDQARELNISLGMIVVAVFALVLMGAGGYGVIEQRAEMQEEIRQLQARLATAAPPREVAATRQEAAEATQRNEQLLQQVDELSRENRNLQAIVSGLEKQLTAQQEAISKAAPAAPKPAPRAAAKPPAPKPAASAGKPAAAGSWFVNFSSYGQRSTAQNWVEKLQPGQGRVVVSPGQVNGKDIYRVRVVDLPDKASAEAIARALEKEYGLPKLWVGRSG